MSYIYIYDITNLRVNILLMDGGQKYKLCINLKEISLSVKMLL